jgi:ribosomal protein S27AE
MFIPLPGAGDFDSPVPDLQQSTTDLRDAIRRLEKRLERQSLVIKALGGLLIQGGAVTEEQLLVRIQQIGEERVSDAARVCPNCGRTMNAKHDKCLYCGGARKVQSALDLI